MPINPMTGQLYSYATGGPPIGLSALDARPDSIKALDTVFGGGAFLSAIKYQSHRNLMIKGEHTSSRMQRLQMRNWMQKSYEKSIDNPTSAKNIFREQGREMITKFNPFTWGRAPAMESMNPETARTEYAISNWALHKSGMDKRGPFKEGGWAHDLLDKDGNFKHALDPNFSSRIGAANTWDRLARKAGKAGESDLLSAEQRSAVESYLKHANPDLLGRVLGGSLAEDATLSDAAMLTRIGASKSITGRMGGYLQSKMSPGSLSADSPLLKDAEGNLTAAGRGYVSGETGEELANVYRQGGMAGVKDLAGKSAEELAVKGFGKEAATRFAEKGAASLAIRAGVELGAFGAAQFVPGLDVAVDAATLAYIAYKASKVVAHMERRVINGAINTVASGVQSYVGDLRKPQFGMGYHDTLAAATSRSRGVMAIQNSRLNARSVLGSEASSIYQHFG